MYYNAKDDKYYIYIGEFYYDGSQDQEIAFEVVVPHSRDFSHELGATYVE